MSGSKILVIDDDSFCLETVKSFLASTKKSIITAIDGEDGVQKFKENAGDICLVLLDIIMPKLDGYQAAEAMRDFEKSKGLKKTKIFGLSGDDNEETFENAVEAGMDSVINKPIKKDALLKLI